MLSFSDQPKVFISGEGWYDTTPYGLNPSSARVRIKFLTNPTAPTLFTLFTIHPKEKAAGCIFTIENSDIIFRRLYLQESKVFRISSDLPLTDGKWHSVDVTIFIDRIDIIIDGKKFQLLNSENTAPIDATHVSLGGFSDGFSLYGKIKDVYFGNQKKLDLKHVQRVYTE